MASQVVMCGLHTALWSRGNEHCRQVICSRWCSFIYFIVCLGTPCLLLRSVKVLFGGQQIFWRIHIRLTDCSQITSSKRGIHKKMSEIQRLMSILCFHVTGYRRKCHFNHLLSSSRTRSCDKRGDRFGSQLKGEGVSGG